MTHTQYSDEELVGWCCLTGKPELLYFENAGMYAIAVGKYITSVKLFRHYLLRMHLNVHLGPTCKYYAVRELIQLRNSGVWRDVDYGGATEYSIYYDLDVANFQHWMYTQNSVQARDIPALFDERNARTISGCYKPNEDEDDDTTSKTHSQEQVLDC